MNAALVLDIVLAFVLVAYAVNGYRQGLISSALSMIGFVAGAALGIWLLPEVVGSWDAVADNGRLRVLALILGVILMGWLGQLLGSLAGNSMRRQVPRGAARRADAVLGALLITAAMAALLWFLGGSLRSSGNPAVAKVMSESRVLRALNDVMPEQGTQVFADFRSFLSNQGFPQVFEGLDPEPIAPIEAPDPGVARGGAIQGAARSVVKVTTTSSSCGQGQEGTGWVLSPGRVVTNAHVVAGAELVRVEGPTGDATARVVVFDDRRDLAVLSVEDFDAPALPLGDELDRGASAVVPGYPLDGPYRVVSARVRALIDARGYDIYGEDRVVREIYSLNTRVQPGNSGGPLLDTEGRVVGVIFAKSLDDAQTGYALTLDEAAPVLDAAATATRPVGTGACLVG